MGVTWIGIKRNAPKMTPVHVPLDQAFHHDIGPYVKPEILQWLRDQGLPDDRHSNEWTFYHDDFEATFFFSDAKIAMLFKLTFS